MSTAKRGPKNSLEDKLEMGWHTGHPDLISIGEWIGQKAKNSIGHQQDPETLQTIVTNIAAGLTSELVKRAKEGRWDLTQHGGLLSYLRKRIQDELLVSSWQRGKPDWDFIAPRAHKLAAMLESRDKRKAQDAAQGALQALWKRALEEKWELNPIAYLIGTIKRLLINEYHDDEFYGELPGNFDIKDKNTAKPMEGGDFDDHVIKIMKEYDDGEILELIASVRNDAKLPQVLTGDKTANETSHTANVCCAQERLTKAEETVKKAIGCNQRLLACWNRDRESKGLPRKKINALENISKRIARQTKRWIAQVIGERAQGCCQCTWFDCSGHSDGERCRERLPSSFKVVDKYGAECVDPSRLRNAFAFCDACATRAKHWNDLQWLFETGEDDTASDTMEMWESIFIGLRISAEFSLRTNLVELRPFLEALECPNKANVFVRLMGKTTIYNEATALARSVMEDFLSGRLPVPEHDVLRTILTRDIDRKIEYAKASVKSPAEATVNETPERKETPADEVERWQTPVVYGQPDTKVVQLHINCGCLAPLESSDKKSESYIQVLIAAQEARGREEKTMVCCCGERRRFRWITEGYMTNYKGPRYESIKGKFEEDDVPMTRPFRAAQQRALIYLRVSYRQWLIASAAEAV